MDFESFARIYGISEIPCRDFMIITTELCHGKHVIQKASIEYNFEERISEFMWATSHSDYILCCVWAIIWYHNWIFTKEVNILFNLFMHAHSLVCYSIEVGWQVYF